MQKFAVDLSATSVITAKIISVDVCGFVKFYDIDPSRHGANLTNIIQHIRILLASGLA